MRKKLQSSWVWNPQHTCIPSLIYVEKFHIPWVCAWENTQCSEVTVCEFIQDEHLMLKSRVASNIYGISPLVSIWSPVIVYLKLRGGLRISGRLSVLISWMFWANKDGVVFLSRKLTSLWKLLYKWFSEWKQREKLPAAYTCLPKCSLCHAWAICPEQKLREPGAGMLLSKSEAFHPGTNTLT